MKAGSREAGSREAGNMEAGSGEAGNMEAGSGGAGSWENGRYYLYLKSFNSQIKTTIMSFKILKVNYLAKIDAFR